MKKIPQQVIWSLLLLVVFVAPVAAQNRKPVAAPAKTAPKPTPKAPVPTFDALLASGSYGVYSEVRGVGQLIRSQGISGLVEPIMKLAGPPKEFQTLVKWLNVNAEALMTSRMMCASWAHRPKLPQFVCAIEFASVEEAQKFEPQLRTFLPKLLPTPTPTPEKTKVETKDSKSAVVAESPQVVAPKPPEPPPPPPFVITQAGSLLFISTTTFKFSELRPAETKLLSEDQDFRTTRDRFASDPIFVYVDLKKIIKEEDERRQKQQEHFEEERKKVEAEAALSKQAKPEEHEESAEMSGNDFKVTEEIPAATTEPTAELVVSPQNTERQQTPAESMAFSSLARAFMGGESKWPDAIGAAISFDNDSYNLRVLLIHPQEVKGVILPFLPQLVSGPPITPAAPSVLPADSEVFVTFSLDYSATHDQMVKAFNQQPELAIRQGGEIKVSEAATSTEPESPFAAYEKILGIKFKEDLIPLLGNEIALSLKGLQAAASAELATNPSPNQTVPLEKDDAARKPKAPSSPIPLVAIAIKDREAVKKLLPRIIASIGLKGAEMLAQTEKREGTEFVSYANAFAYAFIGDFMIVSTEADAVRRAVDSYLKNETLGSDSKYRNFTRWQSRQVLGQVYMPSGTMENSGVAPRTEVLSGPLEDFISGLGPITEPVTYSLSNEGAGPLHELRVPHKLLMLLVAGTSGTSQESSVLMNESMAQSALRSIAGAQETYKAAQGAGSFGTLDQLVEANLISKSMVSDHGYRIDLNASGTHYEASAVPTEYGKTGRRSFFIDATSVLRGGDHGGGPATISDHPIQ